MSEVHEANEVSAILDGGPTGLRVPFRHRGQEQVHNAPANRKGIVWSKPSPGLSDRIMLRASLKRPESARRWPLGLAASIGVAAVVTWIMVGRGGQPATQPHVTESQGEVARAVPTPAMSFEGFLSKIERPAGVVLSTNVERGLINEAQALGEDAQRGVQAVLAKLPMMPVFASGQ